MNIDEIRGDFPALKEWIYLDNAFVGLVPRQVKGGYDSFLEQWMHFRISEGKTILGDWLEKTMKIRSMVAKFLGVRKEEIAFTTCTGSGLNMVVNGMIWKNGDNVVFPEWEHNPLFTHTLKRCGVEIRPVSVREGRVDLLDLEDEIDDNTKLVQISQVGYVNGFRFDLKRVSDMAHEHGAKVLVDATQAVGALNCDYKKDDVDYVSCAPYKYLMGPAGLAFLYIKSEHLKELMPDRVGWKNQIWVGPHAEDPRDLESAEKFEYGTIHFQGIYALEKSLQYVNRLGIENIERRVLELSSYLWERLNRLDKKMYTPKDTKSPIVSFFQNNAVEIASKLMDKRIKVTGREAHGGHIRVSPHFYNTKVDIEFFIDHIQR